MHQKKEYFFNFRVDGLMRGNYQSRMQGYATGINNGFMSPNDIRKLENMDLIPDEDGGNVYMVNGTMMKLSQIGASYGLGSGDSGQTEPEKPPDEEADNQRHGRRKR